MKLERNQSTDSADQKNMPKKKPKSIDVAKIEVSDNIAKFLVTKGFSKKQWVVVREIPILEIEHIEKIGKQLSVTWKGVTDTFFTKEKTDLFGTLVVQVNGIFEDQRKAEENKEKEEKAALRRNELIWVINTSVGVIDQSFNVLIGLQDKRINWERIEGYSNGFGKITSFTGQTMPPLNFDFSKITVAIKTRGSKEASNEAFNILKATYEYFDGLSVDDEFKENHPNFQDAKSEILAYFILNDLLLGKVVGDRANKDEISQLERVQQNLAAQINFKVNIDELKSTINKTDVDNNRGNVIERSREIFKQQLKQKLKPNEEPLTTTQVSSKNEVNIEPTPKNEGKQKAIQVSKVEVSDNAVKFFAAKGLLKKQSVMVMEIPLLEIERIEKFGNESSVTWKGATYTFFAKETGLFNKLVDQVNGILAGVSTEPPVSPPSDATQPAPEESVHSGSSPEVPP